jgi:hypothetical protein
MGHGCTNYGGFGEKELEGIRRVSGIDKICGRNRSRNARYENAKERKEQSVQIVALPHSNQKRA